MKFVLLALFALSVFHAAHSYPLGGNVLLEGAVSSGAVAQQSIDKTETRHRVELEPFIAYSERRFAGN
uniref:Uncharacterized protein n=1 Tax=Ditylenchus dipsaci TaxID=166011 RepID=A0A915DQ41_9BILA